MPRRCFPRCSHTSYAPSHSSYQRPAGRPTPHVRCRAVAEGRSEGIASSGNIRNPRQPLWCWSLCVQFPKIVEDALQPRRRTGRVCATQLGLLSASAGSHAVAVRMCCSLLVKASQLWTPAAGCGSLCVSVRLCQSTCCGFHLGEILLTRGLATPLSPCWKRSLPMWPSQAPTLQFGSAAVACELKLLREPLLCKNWVLAISQKTRPLPRVLPQ